MDRGIVEVWRNNRAKLIGRRKYLRGSSEDKYMRTGKEDIGFGAFRWYYRTMDAMEIRKEIEALDGEIIWYNARLGKAIKNYRRKYRPKGTKEYTSKKIHSIQMDKYGYPVKVEHGGRAEKLKTAHSRRLGNLVSPSKASTKGRQSKPLTQESLNKGRRR